MKRLKNRNVIQTFFLLLSISLIVNAYFEFQAVQVVEHIIVESPDQNESEEQNEKNQSGKDLVLQSSFNDIASYLQISESSGPIALSLVKSDWINQIFIPPPEV